MHKFFAHVHLLLFELFSRQMLQYLQFFSKIKYICISPADFSYVPIYEISCILISDWFRFPTNQMSGFIELAKEKGMADTLSTVCATGGGAYKFEQVLVQL
jgi:hypothetical protein